MDAIYLYSDNEFNEIARETTPCPLVPDSTYCEFGDKVSSSQTGGLAFFAEIEGVGIDGLNDELIIGWENGELSLIARQGMALPQFGDNAVLILIDPSSSFVDSRPSINALGQAVFYWSD